MICTPFKYGYKFKTISDHWVFVLNSPSIKRVVFSRNKPHVILISMGWYEL